jgi:hypothetical protein
MADQEQHAIRRWLLKGLQQGIGSGRFQVVDRIDDRDPPVGKAAGRLEQLGQPADLSDADIAGIVARLLR